MATERPIVVLERLAPGGVAPREAERVLRDQPGVVRVYASASLETVYVAYDPARPGRLGSYEVAVIASKE